MVIVFFSLSNFFSLFILSSCLWDFSSKSVEFHFKFFFFFYTSNGCLFLWTFMELSMSFTISFTFEYCKKTKFMVLTISCLFQISSTCQYLTTNGTYSNDCRNMPFSCFTIGSSWKIDSGSIVSVSSFLDL